MSAETELHALPRWRWFWLAIGCAGLAIILYLALVPLPQVLPPVPMSDKIIHFVVFCGLTIWFAGQFPRGHYGWVAVALLVYGVSMELMQSQVPNRYAEFGDLVADAGGIALGALLARAGLHRWPFWLERMLGAR